MWAETEWAQSIRGAERPLFQRNAAGRTGICLAYPNRYRVAMGNLGFHAVYKILATTPDHYCERAFLPEQGHEGSLHTLESDRPVSDFQIFALSISFETDYLNLPKLFEAAGIPLRSADRDASHPLVIAGGSAIFLNPEPIADFLDLALIGEAEEMLPEFLAALDRTRADDLDRDAAFAALTEVPGVYVPARRTPEFDGPRQVGESGVDAGRKVTRRMVADLSTFSTTTEIVAPDVAFGDMFLVEASRGCQWGCRFCAAGYMYRPLRTRSPAQITEAAKAGMAERKTVGIVGAEIASIPGIVAITDEIREAGGRASPASLKADCVSPELARALGAGGSKTVTIAPEAGSERMRRVINKNLREGEILEAADLLVGEGVEDLKLYFMMGLPTETDADIDAIGDLTLAMRERFMAEGRRRGRVGRITLSVNAFVPKPWTPFQWEPMVTVNVAKANLDRLRKRLRPVANVDVEGESPREAYVQTFLSRGDRRTSHWIEAIHRGGGEWWRELRSGRKGKRAGEGLVDPDDFVHRTYEHDERLPWDFIDHAIDKRYLWSERTRAGIARETPPCDVSTCTSCGAC